MKPRYYQREAKESVIGGWFEHNSGVMAIGTGAGKTAIAGMLIAELNGRCLFCADQNELITQPLKAIQKTSGVIAAVEQAKLRASLNARVVVGSAQTLARKQRRERFPRDHFDYIFIDEAHRGAPRNKEISDYFETAKVCGMTATPFRANLRDLSSYYDTVFFNKPMLDLCLEGFAPPMEVLTLPVEIDLAGCGTAMTPEGRDYKPEDVDSTITPYLEAVAKLVAKYAKHRHTVAYLPLIKTSLAFAEVLRAAGVTARHVDGGSPDREQILESFARGEFSCLCNAGVVSIGVDLPIADTFLNLQPMRSPALYQQRAGRVMRPLPGVIDHLPEKEQADARRELIEWSDKPRAIMFDLLWQHDELGVQRPGALVGASADDMARIHEASKRKLEPLDLIALQKRVQADREEQIVRALEAATVKADIRGAIPFAQAALLIGSRKLLAYEPVARWEMEPATEPQLRALARLGIDTNTVTSKGAAKKLMDNLMFRIKYRFATMKQLKLVMRINEKRDPEARIKRPDRLTVAEAAAVIDADMAARRAARLAEATA